MAKLSEWLDIMLGEISRKQDEAARAAEEQARRAKDPADVQTPSTRSTDGPVSPRNPV